MMISPDTFVDQHKNKSYRELLNVRDELIESLREYENSSKTEASFLVEPSPDVVYQCHLEYLGKLCPLIADKFSEEYIFKDEYCLDYNA